MSFIKDWGMIAGIAGLALGIFLVLFREVLRKKIFPVLTKRQAYIIIIIFMLLVWSLSIFSIVQYQTGKDDPLSVTVLVHGEKGKDDLLLAGRGKVKLIYGDANVVETINDKGEATFKQIPQRFFAAGQTVEILFFDPQNEPYRATHPDSLYTLSPGKYIPLEVKLFGLNSLKGIVTDLATGAPVADARISILGTATFSNKYGEYVLDIPPALQQKFQTVRVLKDGYQPFELSNVPVETESELAIALKPRTK